MKQKYLCGFVALILLALVSCRDRSSSALLIVTDRNNVLPARTAAARSLAENDKEIARRILGDRLLEKWDTGTLDTLAIFSEIGDKSTLVLLRSQEIRNRMLKDEGQVNAAIDETITEIENRLAKNGNK